MAVIFMLNNCIRQLNYNKRAKSRQHNNSKSTSLRFTGRRWLKEDPFFAICFQGGCVLSFLSLIRPPPGQRSSSDQETFRHNRATCANLFILISIHQRHSLGKCSKEFLPPPPHRKRISLIASDQQPDRMDDNDR